MHDSHIPKAKRQRTFTGCRTCRRRRVKCDEQKPTCGHCERLKLDCEGYDALIQWLRPIESTRFVESSEDESSIPLEDQRQSRRQLHSDAQKQAMCISLHRMGSTIDYNKDIYILEENCASSSETFTLGPFGAFSLDNQPSRIATVSESGDTLREMVFIPSPLDAVFANPGVREPASVLPHEDLLPAQPQEYQAQNRVLDTAVPDLPDGNAYNLPPEGLEGSDLDADVVWQNLGWQQSSADLFDGLDQSIIEGTQNAFVTDSCNEAHIQNQLMTMESTYLHESLSQLSSHPLPHTDTLLDLFRTCYSRPGSTWQKLQMPEVQKTLGQIALKVKPSAASSAVLLAVLAVMSFHMDRLNTTEARTGYWWHLGEDYMTQAVALINSLFDDDPPSVDKVRYKTSLMALLTVVAVCLTSGKLEDSRPYLLKTQNLIKRHASPEKQKSQKVRLLHALFVYLRVLEEATYIYPISTGGALSNNTSHIYSVTKYPSLAFKDLLDSQYASTRPNFHDLTVPDFCFEAQNDTIRSLFANTLCLPESLLILLSHITFVACEARQARCGTHTMDTSIMKDFNDRAKVIEDLLCAWTFQSDRQNWSTPDSMAKSPDEDGRHSVLEHIALAFHSALLIYFYREVKQINRLILQPLVQQITTHLIDYENSKQQNNIPSNSVIWPGFMAAIEASEEADFARIMGWMRSCADRYGLRAFDRAITAATDLRILRVHTGTDSWPDSMLQKGIFLVLS